MSRLLLRSIALVCLSCGSLAAQVGGGLYWLAAAFVTGIFACMTNAWVLLIEIKR